MPSSGYGTIAIIPCETEQERHDHFLKVCHVTDCARLAMRDGLFVEWLESFLAAWIATQDAVTAANAGITEWDL